MVISQQLEEILQQVGSQQQMVISQLVGIPQLLQIPQQGRAQPHQIQQHFHPANASM